MAIELALTGELVSAQRLHQYGLVNRMVEPGQALAESRLLAGQIIANAPLSVAASKQVILQQRDWSTGESFSKQEEITGPVIASEDAREGATAFAEKRLPHWTGR